MWATGHHRNGILLAPLTAELPLGGDRRAGERSELLDCCDPARFASGVPAGPPMLSAGAPR